MKLIPDEHLDYILNKYHKESEPFDAFRRFNYHGHECNNGTGIGDAEMENGLNALFDELRGAPHTIAKARAFEFVLDNMSIEVSPKDKFVYLYNWGRPLEKTFIKKWHAEAFSKDSELFRKKTNFTNPAPLQPGRTTTTLFQPGTRF